MKGLFKILYVIICVLFGVINEEKIRIIVLEMKDEMKVVFKILYIICVLFGVINEEVQNYSFEMKEVI